jgi:hypothetical protein
VGQKSNRRSAPLRLDLDQPQDHVAVALAGAAHEAQSVERPIVEPNLPLALFIGLGLDRDRAERSPRR